jgi:hypothetical protein
MQQEMLQSLQKQNQTRKLRRKMVPKIAFLFVRWLPNPRNTSPSVLYRPQTSACSTDNRQPASRQRESRVSYLV